jgi:ABC-type uncharacterized transport system permease subunit
LLLATLAVEKTAHCNWWLVMTDGWICLALMVFMKWDMLELSINKTICDCWTRCLFIKALRGWLITIINGVLQLEYEGKRYWTISHK